MFNILKVYICMIMYDFVHLASDDRLIVKHTVVFSVPIGYVGTIPQ